MNNYVPRAMQFSIGFEPCDAEPHSATVIPVVKTILWRWGNVVVSEVCVNVARQYKRYLRANAKHNDGDIGTSFPRGTSYSLEMEKRGENEAERDAAEGANNRDLKKWWKGRWDN
jgi:hypothetical protein